MQFLMKLRAEYEPVRASLLRRGVTKLDEALSELIREETRLKSQAQLDRRQTSSESAFAVGRSGHQRPQFQRGSTSHLTCHFFHELGHIQPHCKKKNVCIYCKQSGHIVLECKILAKKSHTSPASNRSTSTTQGVGFAVESVFNTRDDASAASGGSLSHDMIRKFVVEALQEALPVALNAAFATGAASGNLPRWLLDSAAFNHMCNNRSNFCSLKPGSSLLLQVANGAQIPAHGVGTVATNDVTLADTLYVPQLIPNLVSVGQLTDEGCDVIFTGVGCHVQDRKTGKVIGRGRKEGRVFVLDEYKKSDVRNDGVSGGEELQKNGGGEELQKNVSLRNSDSCLSSIKLGNNDPCGSFGYSVKSSGSSLLDFSVKTTDWNLWHCRLGHPHKARLLTMFRQNILPAKLSSQFVPPSQCVSCIEAKTSQSSFSSSETVYEAPFDLVHTDLWGPSPVTSRMGFRYFALFIDHATRYTWIYFLRQKSELISYAKEFVQMIATQFGKTVKIIRSDPGGEFTSNQLLEFYRSNGIRSQHSCPGVSQQNGLVERNHRHVLELTRALLFHSHIPTGFWVEAASTVVYLINRQVTQILDQESPFQRLHRRLPDYSFLRVFGCVCYVLLPKKDRHKLDPKTTKCVFVGYSSQHKGYLCYDPNTRRMRISCHVVFLEQVMYYSPGKDSSPTSLDFLAPLPSFDVVPVQADDPPEVPPTVGLINSPPGTPSLSLHTATSTSDDPSIVGSSSSTKSSSFSPNPIASSPPPTEQPPPLPAPCRSTRSNIGRLPLRMNDYVGYSAAPIRVPSHYRFAKGDPQWEAAMQVEFQALEENCTWDVMPRIPGLSVIGSRWVYTVKMHPDGTLDRYKARLVAQGFRQEHGVDYDEIFAPIAKMQTVRSVFAVAAMYNWPLVQLDVKNAFLHGDLKETIYMECPDGYAKGGPDVVCRLRRSLYGLKQAPRAWFEKFHGTIIQAGFGQSQNDPSMFTRQTVHGIIVLLLYVDDMIITGSDQAGIQELTESLHSAFNLKELGDVSYFLGLEVRRSAAGLLVSQRKYISDLLESANMTDCRPCNTPMEQNLKLSREVGDVLEDQTFYRSIVGSLIYLTHTRPDIAYAVQVLSQFVGTARSPHLDAVNRLLRYLKHTHDVGLFFPAEGTTTIEAFADADYAGCLDTRRSTSGWCIRFGKSFISWRCRKQDKVSKSSTEAEYRSMSEVSSEMVRLQRLFQELGVSCKLPMQVYGDNTSAIQIAINPVLHDRTKHIEVHVHYIRQLVTEGVIQISYLSTEDQTADVLTKAVSSSRHWYLSGKLMLRTQHQFEGGC
ncbi:Retrovirus-related Pol polyprotein from transposon TNT 1-94 [Linum grandiflorum]